jgi:hypothetical protein
MRTFNVIVHFVVCEMASKLSKTQGAGLLTAAEIMKVT